MLFKLKQLFSRGLGTIINLDQIIQKQQDRYILCYHRIMTKQQAKNDGAHHATWITPKAFESQIRWMQRVGRIVDYNQIINNELFNDRPWFALSFDDGWKDTYKEAFPILNQYHLPAIIFLATDAVNKGNLFWPEDISIKTMRLLTRGLAMQVKSALLECFPEIVLYNGKRNNLMEMIELWIEELKLKGKNERQECISDYFRRLKISSEPLKGYIMNWDEAREMTKKGICFGSHTHNHTILKNLPEATIENELRQSKFFITNELQIDVDSFCFPNARYSGNEGPILSRCGYRYGFRIDNMSLRQSNNNFYIPRFLVSERRCCYASHFKMGLLEMPLYKSKPHNLIRSNNEQA